MEQIHRRKRARETKGLWRRQLNLYSLPCGSTISDVLLFCEIWPTKLFFTLKTDLVLPCCAVLSHVWLSVAPWTAALQALSMGFSRQEEMGGLPCPPPGHLPEPGIEPASPASAGGFFASSATLVPLLGTNGALTSSRTPSLIELRMTQQSHYWAYTLRKPDLKETRAPQRSLQHCL